MAAAAALASASEQEWWPSFAHQAEQHGSSSAAHLGASALDGPGPAWSISAAAGPQAQLPAAGALPATASHPLAPSPQPLQQQQQHGASYANPLLHAHQQRHPLAGGADLWE